MTNEFWFSKQLYEKPGTIILIILGIIFTFLGITIGGGFLTMNEDSDRGKLLLLSLQKYYFLQKSIINL